MKEEPLKEILDRDLYTVFIREHFKDTLSLLEEVINYGTRLIPRVFESSEKKLHDIVIIVSLLKQAVGLLDAIHILTSHGAVIPSYLALRSLFEISLYLDWIFQEKTEERGMLYFVWENRQKLYWAKSVKKGTPEHEAHRLHMQDAPIGPEWVTEDPNLIEAEIALQERKLNTPECRHLSTKFDARKRGTLDPDWFVPAGVSSLRDMAKRLKKEGIYKILYRSFSKVTHGLAFDKHVRFEAGTVIFEPLRSIEGIDDVLQHTMNFAFQIYRSVLKHYRPEEIQNFNQKYMREWRTRFLTIKKVEYKDGKYVVTDRELKTEKV